MSRDFGNPDSSAVGFFVMASDEGFGDAERAYYNQLAQRLLDTPEHVAYILDLQTTPEARELTTSADGKAVTLMTVLHGDNGTTEATQATNAVRDIAASLDKPAGLEVKFSGPVATTSDQLQAVEHSMAVITGASVILISIALLFAYRRTFTVAFALLILGFSLGLARPVVGLLGAGGILEMSMFTAALMTALVIGAGTDYAVFIVGRFHEARRRGLSLTDAIGDAIGGISPVIIASGLTIAAACMAMLFTEVGIFRTAGPPIAVGILVSLVVSLTLGPALLAILGGRGRLDRRNTASTSERRWRRLGTRVVRHPLPAFFLSIAVMLPLVAVAFTHQTNFDEFSAQPADSESNQGYQLASKHFPNNELLPEYIIVRSDHDMRNTADLAALELIAQSVAHVDGVTVVRSITRPDGTPLPAASLGYQAGVVADGLTEASSRIAASRPDLLLLAQGTTELAEGAGLANQRIPELVAGTDEVTALAHDVLTTVDLLEVTISEASGGDMDLRGAVSELHTTASALSGISALLTENVATVSSASTALATVFGPALNGDCGDTVQCSAMQAALHGADDVTGGAASQALRSAIAAGPGLRDSAAQMSALAGRMHQVADQFGASLDNLAAQGSTAGARERLSQLTDGVRELADGIAALADGAREIAAGTQRIPGTLDELAEGLQLATDHLGGMHAHALNGPGSGFYLPEFALSDPRFVTASQFFLSPDGNTARMVVLTEGSVLTRESFDRIDAMRAAAKAATENTVLADADITSTSFAAVYSDMEGEINRDFMLVALTALAAVTLILIAMLRSVVAPLVIMVWALVSYIATIGIGVAVWQHMLGIPLHWSVIPIAFVVLVGVGADYSMLVITRIREESAATLRGVRSRSGGLELGVIRALGSTGGVITTAGIVFAATMFALMSGGLYLLAQLGFVVGIGLILDILLVRAVLVPSTLLLLGRLSWWPAKS